MDVVKMLRPAKSESNYESVSCHIEHFNSQVLKKSLLNLHSLVIYKSVVLRY